MSGRRPAEARAKQILAELERRGRKNYRDGLVRYGIVAPNALGISVPVLKEIARRAGRDHDLADALWRSGSYDARMMTPFVDEPARVTPAQMDRWAADFDNWAVCDALCFHLFDRTPHAWRKIEKWSRSREEFVKRAAFALLASVALHDKAAADAPFLKALPLIERAASDDRNFVKKGVSWALRGIGRRNAALNAASVAVARRLAASSDAAPRWVGKDALRELTSAAVLRRVGRELNAMGRR